MASVLEKLNRLKGFYDAAYRVCLFACKIFLIGDILITAVSVLGRYISFIPDPAWSEQAVLTLMSYLAVLSAALAIRKGGHIRAAAIDRFLSESAVMKLDVFSDLAVLVLGGIMLIAGMRYALAIGAVGSYETMPWLSRFWMYFPVPVAGFFMIIFELEALTAHLGRLCAKGTEEA